MMFRARLTIFACAAVGLAATALPSFGQVRYYTPAPTEQFYLNSPYDESYGTSPSYVITPYANGPAVRVVERCQYPDGWNVTDYTRDVNGTPAGIEHTCPLPAYGRRIRSRY